MGVALCTIDINEFRSNSADCGTGYVNDEAGSCDTIQG